MPIIDCKPICFFVLQLQRHSRNQNVVHVNNKCTPSLWQLVGAVPYMKKHLKRCKIRLKVFYTLQEVASIFREIFIFKALIFQSTALNNIPKLSNQQNNQEYATYRRLLACF